MVVMGANVYESPDRGVAKEESAFLSSWQAPLFAELAC